MEGRCLLGGASRLSHRRWLIVCRAPERPVVRYLKHQTIRPGGGKSQSQGTSSRQALRALEHPEQPKRADRNTDNLLQWCLPQGQFSASRAFPGGSLRFHKCAENTGFTHLTKQAKPRDSLRGAECATLRDLGSRRAQRKATPHPNH